MQIQSLTNAVIRCAVEWDSRVDQSSQGDGEICACGVKDCKVVETSRAGRRWGTTAAFPGVEPDVMMVASGGKKGGLVTVPLGQFETEDITVKCNGPFQIGNLQVNVADTDIGVKQFGGLWHGRNLAQLQDLATLMGRE
jgi:hypothetical protein